MKKVILFLSFIFVSSLSFAENAIDEFHGKAIGSDYYLCKLQGKTVVLTYKLKGAAEIHKAVTELDECISNAEKNIKTLYKNASILAKKKNADKSLKEFYVQWKTSLAGFRVQSEDSQSTYDKRILDNEEKLNQAWSRVEVDLD